MSKFLAISINVLDSNDMAGPGSWVMPLSANTRLRGDGVHGLEAAIQKAIETPTRDRHLKHWGTARSMSASRHYSVITRSAHSTRETKIVGFPNFAPH